MSTPSAGIGLRFLLVIAVLAAGALAVVFRPRSDVESRAPVPQSAGGHSPRPARSPGGIHLCEVTDLTGIDWVHMDGSSGRHYIIESMSAGVGTLDFDRDGRMDLYLPNGAPLPGAEYAKVPRHALYRNLGGWRFENVAARAGTASTAFGLGIAVADYDGDGWDDIYLNNFGPNILYRNRGDGTFVDASLEAGVRGASPSGDLRKKAGAGACFLDADGDGLLDLYVGNYIDLDLSKHIIRHRDGYYFYPPPVDYSPVPDTLYRNLGGGKFCDASADSGIASHAGRSMGMTAADYDSDGDPDVFVCNDIQENFLFENDGQGRFQQVGLPSGVALSPDGERLANMAVDAGDFDNDGWLDFYTTNYQNQLPMLLRNQGAGLFEDVGLARRAVENCYPCVKWGCAMVDLDNDGHKDLFVANGHTEDNIEFIDRTTAYRTHNILLRNTGQGTFVDVSARSGIRDIPVHAARGVLLEDLDDDGDLDVVVLNSRQRPSVLRNMLYEEEGRGHWLRLELRGVKANRNGIGARVKVVAAGLVQIDEIHSGRGYQSHWGLRLHFGLGDHARADRIEVRWPGGGVEVLEHVPADRPMLVVEGDSRR